MKLQKISAYRAIIYVFVFSLLGCAGQVPPVASGYEYVIPEELREVPRISPEQVKQRLDAGDPVLIVDVRESAHFETQHIGDAISVPLWQIIVRTGEFPGDRLIVFY